MLWFVLCSVPGMVVWGGLHVIGHPLSIEYGIVAALVFGMLGYLHVTRRVRG